MKPNFKTNIVFALILYLSFISAIETKAQVIKMMTYNIRYDTKLDGKNKWDNRKEFLVKQILFHDAKIIGIQEGLKHQVKYLTNNLSNYKYVGVGRDNGKEKGEYSAILYDTLRFNVNTSGTFWLSETPNIISKGWDAALERICTYAHFTDINTNKQFWVFNTHFDHKGENARYESAALILKKIEQINNTNEPVILMGDLNAVPDSKPITLIKEKLQDTHETAKLIFGEGGTFTGFNYNKIPTEQIDYIFSSKQGFHVLKSAILNNSKDMLFPSDHFPVFVELEITN